MAAAATSDCGAGESPESHPIPATIRMHISTAPGTFRCWSATITTNPISASATGHWVIVPIATRLASLPTTSPALRSPMITRKNPIPPAMAIFCERGMLFTTHSRTGRTDRASISTPEQKTAPSATCHDSPIVPTAIAAK